MLESQTISAIDGRINSFAEVFWPFYHEFFDIVEDGGRDELCGRRFGCNAGFLQESIGIGCVDDEGNTFAMMKNPDQIFALFKHLFGLEAEIGDGGCLKHIYVINTVISILHKLECCKRYLLSTHVLVIGIEKEFGVKVKENTIVL